MNRYNAGRFEVEVSGPYPVWVGIRYDGQEIARLRHDEIADLLYVVKRAKNAARNALGDDSDEV